MTPPQQPLSTDTPDRQQREREFHNYAFANAIRKDLAGFYRLTATAMSVFEQTVVAAAHTKKVLEYGCGPGTYSFPLARVAESVTGIDISDVAIDRAKQRAKKLDARNTEFFVMDAENLTFPPATFDLVCGRAILHHLDVRRAFNTIARVLKPGGVALFMEPLGYNPAVNLYRRFTPTKRTPDEHPLLRGDLDIAREAFGKVTVEPYILASLLAMPLLKTPLFGPACKILESVDRQLFRIESLQWYAWTSIWKCEQPRATER